MTTPYDDLRIPASASFGEANAAYKALVRAHHPDRFPAHLHEQKSRELARINAAFEAIRAIEEERRSSASSGAAAASDAPGTADPPRNLMVCNLTGEAAARMFRAHEGLISDVARAWWPEARRRSLAALPRGLLRLLRVRNLRYLLNPRGFRTRVLTDLVYPSKVFPVEAWVPARIEYDEDKRALTAYMTHLPSSGPLILILPAIRHGISSLDVLESPAHVVRIACEDSRYFHGDFRMGLQPTVIKVADRDQTDAECVNVVWGARLSPGVLDRSCRLQDFATKRAYTPRAFRFIWRRIYV